MKKGLLSVLLATVLISSFIFKVSALDPYEYSNTKYGYTWTYITYGSNYAMQLHIEINSEMVGEYGNVLIFIPGLDTDNYYSHNEIDVANKVSFYDGNPNTGGVKIFEESLTDYGLNVVYGGTIEIDLASYPTAKDIYLTVKQDRSDTTAGQLYVDNWGGVSTLTFIVLPYLQVAYINPFTGYYIDQYKLSSFTVMNLSEKLDEEDIPEVEGYQFIGWKTITGDFYRAGSPILEEYLQDTNIPGQTRFILTAYYMQLAGTIPPTTQTPETTVIGEILAMFQGNNTFGFSLVFFILTVITMFIFVWKSFPIFGYIAVHFVLTIIFWVLQLLPIYVIIANILIYAIGIISTIKRNQSLGGGTSE